jgi:Phytanoyl-CoA dioxygenase (PhyH)
VSKGSSKLALSRPLKRVRRELDWTRRRANYTLHETLLSNRSSRNAFRRNPTQLGEAQRTTLERMLSDGIAVTHFDELVAEEGLWDALEADSAGFVAQAEERLAVPPEDSSDAVKGGSEKDAYLIRRYPRISRRRSQQLAERGEAPADASLTLDDPLLRLGLSNAILDVVNAYRGLRTKLVDLDQWYTVPVGAQAGRIKSQKWHRDPEDLHVVKVFLYFSDVDGEAGPFEYVPGSQPGGRHGDLWPWRFRGGNYPSQDEMEKHFPRQDQLTATGPRGTIILCDTSGFHRGGFARSKPRVLSVYTYVSPASLSSRKSRRFSVDRSGGSAQLRPEARFALT